MDTLYHVTFKQNVPAIKREGLRGFNVNYLYDDTTRRHHNSIYAFLDISDALRWWDYTMESINMGLFNEFEPKLAIIEFEDDKSLYNNDMHPQMRREFKSAVYKIPNGVVKPDQIKSIYDNEYIKDNLRIDTDDENDPIAFLAD